MVSAPFRDETSMLRYGRGSTVDGWKCCQRKQHKTDQESDVGRIDGEGKVSSYHLSFDRTVMAMKVKVHAFACGFLGASLRCGGVLFKNWAEHPYLP